MSLYLYAALIGAAAAALFGVYLSFYSPAARRRRQARVVYEEHVARALRHIRDNEL